MCDIQIRPIEAMTHDELVAEVKRLRGQSVEPVKVPGVLEYTSAMGEAGQAYLDRFKYAHPLPGQFRWNELWDAMFTAAQPDSLVDGNNK